jgi:hypothetical protein
MLGDSWGYWHKLIEVDCFWLPMDAGCAGQFVNAARVTHLFVDDSRAVRHTIDHLHDFAQAYPDVIIVPSHCPEAFAQEVEPYYEGD